MKAKFASKLTNKEIIIAVKRFYKIYKHFPFKRDFRNDHSLPSRTCLWRRFGSIERLARLSGLKPNHKGAPPGEHSPTWKGGRINAGQGYIRVWVPRRRGYFRTINGKHKPGNYILEHRLVMQNFLGRKLKRSELVHHRNGVKDDNRLENLEIVTRSTHRGHVMCPRCEYNFKVV